MHQSNATLLRYYCYLTWYSPCPLMLFLLCVGYCFEQCMFTVQLWYCGFLYSHDSFLGLDRNKVSVGWCVHLNFTACEQFFCTKSCMDHTLGVFSETIHSETLYEEQWHISFSLTYISS